MTPHSSPGDRLTAGQPVAVVVAAGGVVLATDDQTWDLGDVDRTTAVLAELDATVGPRWVWWSARSVVPALLAVDPGLRLGRCWDLAAAHRLLHGGSADGAAQVWVGARGLDPGAVPRPGQLDLLAMPVDRTAADDRSAGDEDGDPERPVRPDGYLRPDWVAGAWAASAPRAGRWAVAALEAQRLQEAALREGTQERRAGGGHPSGDAVRTAWSESAAELVAVELSAVGLPFDVPTAGAVIASFAGARPLDERDAVRLRSERDAPVLAFVPGRSRVDLRSPAQVKALLADVGIEVADTRSWRLERMRTAHPVVEALLAWRQSERFVTAYGYRWVDEHVGTDGRLRGTWSGSDGGAGRMTAQAGLHSMPRELRVAVRAEPGHLLVRADLGQVEPRVLAAVSGDPALTKAATQDDLYAPVAARLGCERPIAKVAVLAAMYGQTSGAAGEALRGMEASYPVAMAFLTAAHASGRDGHDVHTFGGRRVRMWPIEEVAPEAGEAAARAYHASLAARGRFARNAVVQGAAAELFKAWTATVRARLARQRVGEIVLCLHDELVLNVRRDAAEQVAVDIVADLQAAAGRWCHGSGAGPVRFVADVSVVECWADAKA